MDRVQAGFTPATRDIAHRARRAAAGDPRLRSGQGGGGGGGGGAARARCGRSWRPAAARSCTRPSRAMRGAPLLAALLLGGCASGVPVERQVVVSGSGSPRSRARPAFLVRTFLPDEAGERREVVGARCAVVSSLYSAELVTPSRLVVPNFGPQSPEIERRLHRGRAGRQRHRPHRHPMAGARPAPGAIPGARSTGRTPGGGPARATRSRTIPTSRSSCGRAARRREAVARSFRSRGRSSAPRSRDRSSNRSSAGPPRRCR